MYDPLNYGHWWIDYCVLHEGRLVYPTKPIKPMENYSVRKPSASKHCYHCGLLMSTWYFYSENFGPTEKKRDPWHVYAYEVGGDSNSFGFSVLCEDCWGKLTPRQRLAYHLSEAKESNWFLEVDRIYKAVLKEKPPFSLSKLLSSAVSEFRRQFANH